MILIGLGANLPGMFGAPADAIEAALAALDRAPCRLVARSRLYESPPWPQPSDQPWYVNAVARIETALAPEALLDRLHAIEREFGRERGARGLGDRLQRGASRARRGPFSRGGSSARTRRDAPLPCSLRGGPRCG